MNDFDLETSVNIEIFGKDIRIYQVLHSEDYAFLLPIWNVADPELKKFVEGTVLDGAEKWSDLSILQFRLLIVQAVDDAANLPDKDLAENCDCLKRVRFFISAMLVKYREVTGDHLEHLKVQHIAPYKVNFQMLSSQTLTIEDEDEESTTRSDIIRIVVDNTKDEHR